MLDWFHFGGQVLHSLLLSKALPTQTGFQMHLSLAKITAFIYNKLLFSYLFT